MNPIVTILMFGLLLGSEPLSPVARNNHDRIADRRDAILRQVRYLARLPFRGEEDSELLNRLLVVGKTEYPDDGEFFFWNGEVLEQEAKVREAELAWQEALRLIEKNRPIDNALKVSCLVRLGYAALSRNDGILAADYADRAITTKPGDERGYRLLFDSAYRTGELIGVRSRIAAAYAENSSPELLRLVLEVHVQTGNWHELPRFIDQALSLDSVSTAAHHALARLAELEGNQRTAFIEHFIASNAGNGDDPLAVRSEALVQQTLTLDPENLPDQLKPIVTVTLSAEQQNDAEKGLLVLSRTAVSDRYEELWALHVKAVLLSIAGQAKQSTLLWEKLIERWPNYVPGLLAVGKAWEVNGRKDEALRIFKHAKEVRPHHSGVSQIFRLGAFFEVHDEGVKVTHVEPLSPLGRFGLKDGDVITELDNMRLSEQGAAERLHHARLFQGGRVTYRDSKGISQSREMEIVLFRF